MKKIYASLSLLLLMLAILPAGAQEKKAVLASLGDTINQISDLTVGEHKLVLYNNGRQRYLCDQPGSNVLLKSPLTVGGVNSVDFVWTFNVTSNDGTTADVEYVKGNTGGFMPALAHGGNVTLTTNEEERVSFKITADETGAGFLIQDQTNNEYFNGNGGNPGGFTGWDAAGGNSIYILMKANVEEKSFYTLQTTMTDNITMSQDTTITIAIGDTIPIPVLDKLSPVSMQVDYIDVPLYGYIPEDLIDGSGVVYITYEPWPTITYHCTSDDKKLDSTVVTQLAKGSTFTAPSFPFYVLTTDLTDKVVSADDTLELSYKYQLPFEPTTVTDGKFAENTKWYFMQFRGNKYAQYEAAAVTPALNDSTPGTSRAYKLITGLNGADDKDLWAFVAESDTTFKIYNKATGATKVLFSESATDADYPLLVDESTITAEGSKGYILGASTNANKGYTFRKPGTEDGYFNDFAGNNVFGYWKSTSAVGDIGSSVIITWANVDSIKTAIVLNKAKRYLRAEGVVSGWTKADLANLKTSFEAKDTTQINTAIEALVKLPTIKFDASKSYAIESAFVGFGEKQPDAIKAIYVTKNDTTDYLAWKDYTASPNLAFAFKITEGEKVADTTMISIQSEAIEKYVQAYSFGKIAELKEESVEYQLFPSTATPGSFHIMHVIPLEDGGSTKVAFCTANGDGDATATEGTIGSYNKVNTVGTANYWYLRPLETVTNIGSVATSAAADNAVYYDLNGRRIDAPVKGGIYVVKGKKVIK